MQHARSRGWVERREAKPGTVTYRAMWWTPEGKRRSKTFERKIDAQEYLDEKRNGFPSLREEEEIKRVTVAEFYRMLCPENGTPGILPKCRKKSSLAVHEQTWREFQAHAPEYMDEITLEHTTAYANDIGARVSENTVRKHMRSIRAGLNRAVKLGFMSENPVTADEIPKGTDTMRGRALEEAEVRALYQAAETLEDKCFLRVAVEGGLRVSEILSLRWEDMDLVSGRIKLQNRADYTTKSKRGREVRVWPDSLPYMEALFENRDRTREKVFHFHKRYWLTRVKAMAKAAQIPPCTVHDMRRTCATFLLLAGVPVTVVQRYMGHSDIETTLRFYQQIPQREIEDAALRAQGWFQGNGKKTHTKHTPFVENGVQKGLQKSPQVGIVKKEAPVAQLDRAPVS